MGGNWSSLEREASPDPQWPAPQLHSGDTCTTDQDVQLQGAETIQKTNEESHRLEEINEESHRLEEINEESHRLEEINGENHRVECVNVNHRIRESNEGSSRVETSNEENQRVIETIEESDSIEEAIEERRRGQVKQKELESFKEELERKRAMRHEALAALQTELYDLRNRAAKTDELQQQLEEQREENRKLVQEKEKLMEQIEHKEALEKQIQALKDVSEIGKEMLKIRELQVKELKKKLVEINISSVTAPPEDLRLEYEKQIENIRKLRTLYEERAAATLLEHRRQLEREEARITVLETKLSELQKETDECKEAKQELEGKIENLESSIQAKEDELVSTKDKLFSSSIQNKSLNSQIKLINNLFSQMLVSPKVDLDRLIRLLKENHGLITDLTDKGDSNEVAALLVDLAGQVEKENEKKTAEVPSSSEPVNKSDEQPINGAALNDCPQSEIASNLSKVWKVMIELLSHHQNSSQETEISGGADSCYKSIQTPSGPRSVISVSQTFITLKDLILEKNRLVKEVGRLKTLNNHLEHRLGSQEKRLIVVTSELRKTWGVVNKLKAQHKQLHTHEKILRYELQQKRCMLNELKQELDHCRDKWEQARQKNSQTEEDWKKLRKEFALRKSRKESNSAESGYEEDDIAQSPPSEPIENGETLFVIQQLEGCETELSEEDIEHSDGNSFDTVIDLLDMACIDNQASNETDVPFALCEAPPEATELSPNLLPLTGSEFTEGLDQIESADLAAVLDVQYQNQLLGADYNLSLPSSSGSSPIPTENDDFASSELDISEEDLSSNENHVYTTPLPVINQTVSEDKLLFGSNSSKNISKFLEGLFSDQESNGNTSDLQQNLHLNVPTTSQKDENGSTTPIVDNQTCYQFPEVNFSKQAVYNNPNESIHNFDGNDEACSTEQQVSCQSEPSVVSESFINSDCMTASSNSSSPENNNNSEENELRVREERLKKLEKQCRSLVTKVMSTSFRSDVLSNKLDEMKICYDSTDEIPIATKEETVISSNDTTTLLDHSCSAKPSQSESVQGIHLQQEKQKEDTIEVRTARVTRLEDQCKSLFTKMSASSSRSQSHSTHISEQGDIDQLPENKEPLQGCISRTKGSPSVPKRFDRSDNADRIQSKRPNDIDSESKAILRKCSQADQPSETNTTQNYNCKKDRTPEQILEARAERFRRLEEQCKSLVSRMTVTSLRSEIISNKLDELHSCYGSSEGPSCSGEHSPSSLEGRARSSPNTSPRNSRRAISSMEKENSKEEQIGSESGLLELKNTEERVTIPLIVQQQVDTNSGANSGTNSGANRLSKTPEEIMQARAQRLNRLEEQCKSLFSKMSATSQRSDAISNKLEELHEQYGQPSTSENGTSNTNSVATTTKCDTAGETGLCQDERDNVSETESRTDNNEEKTE